MVRTWADIADRGLNVIFPTRYYTHIHKRIEYQPSLEPIDPRNDLYSYVCGGRAVMLDLEACVFVYIFECMRKLSSNDASARQSPSIDKKHFVRHTTPRNRCAWTHSLVLRFCWQFLHQLTLSTLVINIGRIAKEFRCGRLWRMVLNVSNSINNTTHTHTHTVSQMKMHLQAFHKNSRWATKCTMRIFCWAWRDDTILRRGPPKMFALVHAFHNEY